MAIHHALDTIARALRPALAERALCAGCNGAEGGGFGADQRESQLTTYRANPPAARFAWTYPGAEPNR
ncbi:hypothetical protein [Amycolatopsis sp. cmx-11-51]|uniref:hypothetical protein n=1 Tax=Amycolatopsis sp. cmx-11-51 TaxID=2785797 RepID=UPI0039E4B369